jgi:DNA polymerase-3 subunit epsilon
MIARHQPPYNRHGKRWRSYAYLKIDPGEAWPRVKTARAPVDDGSVYLGPFPSLARARLAKEALEEVFPVRRCTRSMGRATRFAPCALADMGRCLAPCDGRTEAPAYGEVVTQLVDALADPDRVLMALEGRMSSLAEQERYEEAALARHRLRALAEALWRRRVDRWLTDGELTLRTDRGELLRLRHGSLTVGGSTAPDEPIGAPPPRERADELSALRSWVCRHRVRVEGCDRPPAEEVAGGRELARLLRMVRGATDRGRSDTRR